MALLWDVLALLGLALFLAGCWCIWEPLALLCAGLILIALGIVGAKRWGR